MKIIETKKAKWEVYFCYRKWDKNEDKGFRMTSFYLLPTIEYYRDKTFDEDGDCSFNVSFSWLFWSITVSQYWGSAYEKKGE